MEQQRVEISPEISVRDERIKQIGLTLFSELEAGGTGDRLYAESLANVLAIHLLRNYSNLGQSFIQNVEPHRKDGLSEHTLRRVTDYIDDDLSRNLTLAELARVAHMSPYHFSRMFKQSTGISPHQYLIRQRAEKARALLIGTDLPIYEVAREAGFHDQSHLARHFRRIFGVSPGRLR